MAVENRPKNTSDHRKHLERHPHARRQLSAHDFSLPSCIRVRQPKRTLGCLSSSLATSEAKRVMVVTKLRLHSSLWAEESQFESPTRLRSGCPLPPQVDCQTRQESEPERHLAMRRSAAIPIDYSSCHHFSKSKLSTQIGRIHTLVTGLNSSATGV